MVQLNAVVCFSELWSLNAPYVRQAQAEGVESLEDKRLVATCNGVDESLPV